MNLENDTHGRRQYYPAGYRLMAAIVEHHAKGLPTRVAILQADMAEVKTDIHYMRIEMRERLAEVHGAINKPSDQLQASNAAMLEVLQGISAKLDDAQ